MGISASKRVKSSLSNSAAFDSACDLVFNDCLSLTQHAFPGVLRFQLPAASDDLHKTLRTLHPHPLILKWVPSPPTRSQVDSALKAVAGSPGDLTLGTAQFKEWAVELFAGAVVENAGKEVMWRVPVGVAGIAGIGAGMRFGNDLVGTAIGIYALGVATSVFLSLSGHLVTEKKE